MANDAELQQLLGNPFIRSLIAGRFVLTVNPSGARTDTGADGETNLYVSGSDLVLQVYSASAGAWKSETLA